MTTTGAHETWRLAEELLAASRVDTAFADLFLLRARELLDPELSEAQWARLEDAEDEVATLTNAVESAMDAGDWAQVQALAARVADAKRAASAQAPLRDLASRVYGLDDVLVDPFSPGLAGLAGVPERELPALRDAAVKRLERLRSADPAWADLYAARAAALGALRVATLDAPPDDAGPSAAALQVKARKALADGDLAQVAQLSARIQEAERSATAAGARADREVAGAPMGDLVQPLAAGVRDRAAKLGLAAHRVESTAEQVRTRFRPAWRPVADRGGTAVHLSVSVPGDAPEALRDTLELLRSRAFVTSAGTRYMPSFVAEDVLVEDFDEPSPEASPGSPLLGALGLPARRGLARRTIEKALRARGAAVVRELGLDPRAHRIACLPVDLYTRLGAKRGWGKQPIWTHFDGYMASKDRKLLALAGGDARYGGLHDLVAVGADYDSDRIFARFAIVQRRRFSTW